MPKTARPLHPQYQAAARPPAPCPPNPRNWPGLDMAAPHPVIPVLLEPSTSPAGAPDQHAPTLLGCPPATQPPLSG
jgi:hypothetical protein